ncbi:LD-carboxypeptidase [Enterococcus sp. BWM-S5]|uniref:LD-carboxypeptidase n=1 Tax=Enterococcus larvae TaxID=2794352 RepID=A0ABS4CH30_9ENTE|nr:S66 peptidase family protein [Enterococcus larvae]MBP1045461.1 LD-carboxypeptidase [Enterococcus larvae]
MIIPEKLKAADEIRVISPSSSIERTGGIEANKAAEETLQRMGFKVSFGQHILENDVLGSAAIESRVDDIHQAFLDENVKGILTSIGGFNCNELLPHLDYDLIKRNPKILCGYSDITALSNAIYTRTGLVTYSGPHYTSFKMKMLQDYQMESFKDILMNKGEHLLTASAFWSNDPWFLPNYSPNILTGKWQVYSEGVATGISIGGNIGTFNLLQGTIYQPMEENVIGFVELEEEADFRDFTRELASFLQVHSQPKALLIGRFPQETGVTEERLLTVLNKYPILSNIPVIYDMDFGHTQPIFTFPIGQVITVDTFNKQLIFSDEQ